MTNNTNTVQIFNNPEFGEVRVVTIDNEPWFVGKDVAERLGYSNASKAVSTHVDDEDKSFIMVDIADSQNGNVPTGQTKTAIINESGLYSLVLSSKLPTAKQFKRWITHEVIPSIRKHGAYMTPETVEQVLSDPDTIIKLATQLKEERAKRQAAEAENKQLSATNKIMKPKAEYFDGLVERNLLTNFRDTAKEFHVSQKEFISKLLDGNYIYRDMHGSLRPCSQFSKEGWFEIKEFKTKGDFTGVQTLITPKGRIALRMLIGQTLEGDDSCTL